MVKINKLESVLGSNTASNRGNETGRGALGGAKDKW